MKELDPMDEDYRMKHMEESLSVLQMYHICTYLEREKRTQLFIEILTREMSTHVFLDLLFSLKHYKPHVRQELLDAYEAEGGSHHKCPVTNPCC